MILKARPRRRMRFKADINGQIFFILGRPNYFRFSYLLRPKPEMLFCRFDDERIMVEFGFAGYSLCHICIVNKNVEGVYVRRDS